MEMIETPRWEDFDYEYVNDNPFTFMGNGVSQRESRKEDLTYCEFCAFIQGTHASQELATEFLTI